MDAYVARQPVLDRREKVFAYELLFREGGENTYHAENGDEATSDVIRNSFLSIGMDTFLDLPLADILADLPLTLEIKRALLGENSRFRDVFALVLAYEKADWIAVGKCAHKAMVSEALVPRLYVRALASANKLVPLIKN